MAENDATQDPADDAENVQWPDRYFRLTDGTIARLADGGWRSQVWHASTSEWADYPDLDVAGEASEIPEAEALALTSGEGEFAGKGDGATDAAPSGEEGHA